jgi:hypothetical protein
MDMGTGIAPTEDGWAATASMTGSVHVASGVTTCPFGMLAENTRNNRGRDRRCFAYLRYV